MNSEELASLLRQPPPRAVPDTLKKDMRAILFPASKRLLMYSMLALNTFVLVSLPAVILWKGAWKDLALDIRPTAVQEGRVDSVEVVVQKNAVANRLSFSFTTPSGFSASGVCLCPDAAVTNGMPVAVRYLAADPSVSRIEGCSVTMISNPLRLLVIWIVGIMICYPAILLSKYIHSSRALGLVRNGRCRAGVIRKISQTRVTVAYEQEGRPQEGIDIVNIAHVREELLAKQASSKKVLVLAEPKHPERVLIVNRLIRLDEQAAESLASAG